MRFTIDPTKLEDLIKAAKGAQKEFATFSQEKIDSIVEAISMEVRKHSVNLAKMANEETGFGKWEDKVIKNKFASEFTYDYIKKYEDCWGIKGNKKQ